MHQALMEAENLRKDLAIDDPLPDNKQYANLQTSAEVARLCLSVNNIFTKRDDESTYNASDAREDLVRGMRKTRTIIAKEDENKWIPAPFRVAILDGIWAKAKKAK